MKEWTEIPDASWKALLDIGQSLGSLIKPIHTETTSTKPNEPKIKAWPEELFPGKLW